MCVRTHVFMFICVNAPFYKSLDLSFILLLQALDMLNMVSRIICIYICMFLQLCAINRHKSFPLLYNSFSLTQTSLHIFRILCVLFCICFGQNKQASEEDGGSQGDGIEYFTLFFSL